MGRHGKALGKDQPSADPGDLVQPTMLKPLLDTRVGTGQKSEMPKPRRPLFRQGYWGKHNSHPDYYSGDPFGTAGKDFK